MNGEGQEVQPMVGKVSLQSKIAELESRIAALEKGRTTRTVTETVTTVRASGAFGEHWDKMWNEFHLMMGEMFK